MEWYYVCWSWLTSRRVARVCQHQLSFLLLLFFTFTLYYIFLLPAVIEHKALQLLLSLQSMQYTVQAPHLGSGVVRMDPLRFLVGCCKRRLNQAPSVLSLSLGFFWCMCCVISRDSFFRWCYFYVICVFCLLVVLVRLSVPVQVIDWKDSSPKGPIMCWWGR